MLKIGDFSKLSRITIRMLRHYDEIGLLCPESTDKFTGYRYYSEAQLPIANRITALKGMGFGLVVIREILKSYTDADALRQFLLLKQTEIREQADKTERQLALLASTINRLGKEENFMNYSVTVKTLPERYVASVRKIIPAYDQESMLWGIMMQEAGGQNLQPADPCYSVAIFYDEGYKESDVDIEIQCAVKGSYKDTKNVVFKTMPPVQVASATYKGSYEQITAVNEAVANFVADNGYEFNGPTFCIYHVSPAQTQNPDEYVTEVCCPVKKK